jgi:hypothetical protein
MVRGTGEKPMTFEEALAEGGPLVAAWDDRDEDGGTLHLFSLGVSGAERVAVTIVPEREREAMVDRLFDQGVRVGATYEGCDLVWVVHEHGFSIWSSDGIVADADESEVRLFEGAFDANDVTRVISFSGVGDEDEHYGVKLAIGETIHVTAAASSDGPRGWASFLGHDLALWFSVPHDDAVEHTSNALELQIAAAAQRLADRVDVAPPHGKFEHVTEPIGPMEGATDVALLFGISPFDTALRYVELVVQSRSPKRTLKTGRWVRKGDNDRIASFLRAARTPRRILRKMREILRGQRTSDYA